MARATAARATFVSRAPDIGPPAIREVALRRVFNAPRHLVFDALTRPELLERWLGPRGWSLIVCDLELKVGGAYRFVARSPHGTEIGWGGLYREIVPPRRLIRTERFDDDWIGGETLVTAVLTEQAGMTTLVSTLRHALPHAGDVRKAPMRREGIDCYDRLAEFSVSTLGQIKG
jgi:uncharacterized protein YndB with AHSA1/START domain